VSKVVFLDRDGTINKEVNYLYKPNEFVFIPGTVEAIKIFHEQGFKVIVITNQAGVARGYYSEMDIKVLHKHLDGLLATQDTYIDAYYYCPHHPDGTVEGYKGECNCRKPHIGMIEKAIKDFNVDLKKSIIIGDKEIDVQTGKNAGIANCVLVRSGQVLSDNKTVADSVYDNLIDFAKNLK
jgi:D-glycero-D-manno-heptose 1,7-bisphosphate phosphatase